MTLCACGCGREIIFKIHHKYRNIKYINGHCNKGRKRPDLSERNKNKKMYGENNPFYGKHHTKEEKIHHSNIMKGKLSGENNPFFGKYGEKSSNWQGGKSFEPYCPKFNNRLKEKIRNKYNRKCYICNRNEKDNITRTGKFRRLSIHHIDRDKEQGCNGKPFKLIPLCMYCHPKNEPNIK